MTAMCERCGMDAPAPNDDWCKDCILEVEIILAEMEERQEPDFRWRALGNNGKYTFEDLEMRVAEYEDEYGLPSDALLEMHRDDRAPDDLTSFDRHVWLSLYREMLEHKQ